jgi:hypothetical protein
MSPATISCPYCTHEVPRPDQPPGAWVACPKCQISFPLLSASESDSSPRSEDAEPDSADQGEGGDAPGLDLTEQHNPQMNNKGEANACLERWQRDMPAVTSAYEPSGNVPTTALMAMTLGASIGVIGATLAALGIGAVTMGILNGVAWVMQWKVKGKLLVLVFGVGCTALLAGYAVMYVLVGMITASCTTRVGQRLGKNRSTAAAAIVSIAATGVSLALLQVCNQSFGEWCDPGVYLRTHLRWGRVEWLVRGLEIAGAIVAVCIAGSRASDIVKAKKFCENCELFMEESTLPEVGLGGLRILTAALNAGEVEAAAYLLDDPPAGQEGKAVLFSCPMCGEAFLEVHAQFHATWTKEDKTTDSNEQSWMTASVPLRDKESELFRLVGGRGS